ncbi:glycoside hydrolase family 3 protein [Deinococcus multiflagellatus]|uniref:Glycoside hydrolase family 3 protein n=1 Tax=Deinococcus multiflagellatus TaxID=1656887 RepID=A0ABW1ZHA8_9DEIO
MTSLPQPGELLMVDIPGPTLDDDTADHLQRCGIRSVCLFGKNVQSEPQLRALCADLRAVLGAGALIAMDHEGGAILRPTFWPFAPGAMTLGAADDPALTGAVSAALARQLRRVGVNWNFAPVLDVNVNPANPVIGERAFGADPAAVIRHGRAALRGHAGAGVAACVKHFPGHGDTVLDSHLALPTVPKPRAALDATELAPFRALLPEAPAVMTAHIVYPALDPQHPATLSRAILTDLLRRDWGYEGVIVTDSMGMQAIDGHYGRGEAAVLALGAGADLVMALGRREAQDATLAAVAEALATGRLDPAQMTASLGRLRALAQTFPAQVAPTPDPGADEALFARAWAAGLTAYRTPQAPRPARASCWWLTALLNATTSARPAPTPRPWPANWAPSTTCTSTPSNARKSWTGRPCAPTESPSFWRRPPVTAPRPFRAPSRTCTSPCTTPTPLWMWTPRP